MNAEQEQDDNNSDEKKKIDKCVSKDVKKFRKLKVQRGKKSVLRSGKSYAVLSGPNKLRSVCLYTVLMVRELNRVE